jgi:hypothetical protein
MAICRGLSLRCKFSFSMTFSTTCPSYLPPGLTTSEAAKSFSYPISSLSSKFMFDIVGDRSFIFDRRLQVGLLELRRAPRAGAVREGTRAATTARASKGCRLIALQSLDPWVSKRGTNQRGHSIGVSVNRAFLSAAQNQLDLRAGVKKLGAKVIERTSRWCVCRLRRRASLPLTVHSKESTPRVYFDSHCSQLTRDLQRCGVPSQLTEPSVRSDAPALLVSWAAARVFSSARDQRAWNCVFAEGKQTSDCTAPWRDRSG